MDRLDKDERDLVLVLLDRVVNDYHHPAEVRMRAQSAYSKILNSES